MSKFVPFAVFPSRLLLAAAVLGNSVAATDAQLQFRLRHSTTEAVALRSIATSGSTLVAVGDHGSVLTSHDGRDWRAAESGTRETLHGVAFAGGRFVAVGNHGAILWSDDGLSWQAAVEPGTLDHLYSVTWGKGHFVAVGDYGVVVTSSDGDRWTEVPRVVLTPILAVKYGLGWFAAGGADGVLLRSTDGMVWGRVSVRSANGLAWSNVAEGKVTGIAAVTSAFVAITETDRPLAVGGTVDESFNWNTAGALPSNGARLQGVAVGAEKAVAVGERGTVLLFDPWQTISTAVGAENGVRLALSAPAAATDLHAVVFAQDTFVVVGDNQTILQSDPVIAGAFRNISVRAETGSGERTLIAGFAIRGQGAKRVLIRGAGPSLASLGVARPLADPTLSVYDGGGGRVATNAGWDTSDAEGVRTAARQVGAFPFAEGSADCALVLSLAPGIHTAQVTTASSGRGNALLEIYDLDTPPLLSRITNVSARAFLDSDGNPILPGVTLSGRSRKVLLRVSGPALSNFGVVGFLPDPRFRFIFPGLPPGIHWSGSPPTAGPWYDTWHEPLDYSHAYAPDDIRETAAQLGAFPLPEGSRDAAGLAALTGSPVIEIGDATGSSGIMLFELYDAADL